MVFFSTPLPRYQAVYPTWHPITGALGLKNLIYIISIAPHPVTVTTKVIPFLVGNPDKPSFMTVTGWGKNPRYTHETSGKRPNPSANPCESVQRNPNFQVLPFEVSLVSLVLGWFVFGRVKTYLLLRRCLVVNFPLKLNT